MAFNIDIELGLSPENPKIYRIYCATLTNIWHADRSPREFEKFAKKLVHEKSVKPKVPLPKCPAKDDARKVETYVSRLGMTPATLRYEGFQEFLNVPANIRGGLTYVSQKPFGDAIIKGVLKVHARFVKIPPHSRYIEMTGGTRNSYLCIYTESGAQYPIAAMKFTAQSKVNQLPEIKNALVIKSGKRQWIIQASGHRQFEKWLSKANQCLKAVGAQVAEHSHVPRFLKKGSRASGVITKMGTLGSKMKHKGMPPGLRRKEEEAAAAERKAEYAGLVDENRKLKAEIVEAQKNMRRYKEEIAEFEQFKEEKEEEEKVFREEKWKDLQNELEDLEGKHHAKMERLRQQIEKLHLKIEEKNRREGFYRVGTLFTEGFDDEAKTDLQASEHGMAGGAAAGGGGAGKTTDLTSHMMTDAEMKGDDPDEGGDEGDEDKMLDEDGSVLDVQKEETQGATSDYSYTYRNMHKHTHIHILHHKHNHWHDDTVQDEVVFSQTETMAHSIVHTATQFQIKKSLF